MHQSVLSQEKDAAKIVGGQRHAGSGAIQGFKSDASSKEWQVECKQTSKDSISLKSEWLIKIQKEAMDQQKWPLLHIQFSSLDKGQIKNWVMIPEYVFESLKNS